MTTRRLRLLLALLAGCTAAGTVAMEQTVSVAGWRLRLVERANACFLEYAKNGAYGELALAPTPPCRFVDAPGAFPQTAEFDDPKRTLVIVFGAPYRGHGFKKLRNKGAYCGTASQAVILTEVKIRLSKRIAEGGVRCEGYGVDQREFVLFDGE